MIDRSIFCWSLWAGVSRQFLPRGGNQSGRGALFPCNVFPRLSVSVSCSCNTWGERCKIGARGNVASVLETAGKMLRDDEMISVCGLTQPRNKQTNKQTKDNEPQEIVAHCVRLM